MKFNFLTKVKTIIWRKNMHNNKDFHILENDNPLDIRKDNVFKAVFTKETPESRKALSALVSALTGKNVTIISILANEPAANNTRDRQIRFDINCKTNNGEFVNVEMSFNPDYYEPLRMEFYAAKLYTGQDIKGIDKSYNDLKEVFQITILAKERFFPNKTFFHTFKFYDPVNHVPFNGRIHIITLELSKLDEIIKKTTEEMSTSERWAVYFRYLTDRSKRSKINEILESEEGIAMTSQVLMTISRDEEERFRIIKEEMNELDLQSKIVEERRKWQTVIADKDNLISNKDAEIALLREQLAKQK
jgi:predicted transposase/invertase (TIGR01784 family)